MEKDHPHMINRQHGPNGKPLKDKFVGYRFVKKNEANGVRVQIWQDTGDNEGARPANAWNLVADWLETEFNWQNPPSDHAETIRIDDPGRDGLERLEYKWISLSEISS